MRSRTALLIAALALTFSSVATAQSIEKKTLPSAVGKISLGASYEEVTKALGQPVSKVGPVGTPTIERWSYADGVQVVFVDGRATDVFIAR